jgi:hypothetical protein
MFRFISLLREASRGRIINPQRSDLGQVLLCLIILILIIIIIKESTPIMLLM